MSWELTTSAKKLLKISRTDNKYKVVEGSTGAGKTFNILPILLDKAIKTPNLEISVVAETVPHLRKGAMKDFLKICRLLGRYNPYFWNKGTSTYTLPNGSYIEFFSADNADKLKGARRDILYVNECDRISLEAFNQLNIRTHKEVWLDFNPIGHFWVYDEVLTREGVDYLHLTYKDNEKVAESVLEDIAFAKKRADEGSTYWRNWYRVYGLGLKGQLDGAVITEYEEIEDFNPEECRLVSIGVDFGYTNDPSAGIAIWKKDEEYIVDEVLYSTGLKNKDLAEQIKAYLEEYKYPVEEVPIYVDNAEPKSRDEIIDYGLPTTQSCTNKYIIQGVNLINQQKNLITSRSENLLNEIGLYVYAKDKLGNKTNKPEDNNNHSIDAWRYGLVSHLDNPTAGEYYLY